MSAPIEVVAVDRGPVLNAVTVLVLQSTLASHVSVTAHGPVSEVRIDDDIPFDQWGSGTQALWGLLCAIATRRHEVSLYATVERLDRRNTVAVADAISALCEVTR